MRRKEEEEKVAKFQAGYMPSLALSLVLCLALLLVALVLNYEKHYLQNKQILIPSVFRVA